MTDLDSTDLGPMPVDPTQDFVSRIQNLGERSSDDQVSPKGAVGSMQVMPGTLTNPGFGIAPADPTKGITDVNRVGREFAQALHNHYGGDDVLASAAYNAGPGRVNQWLQQFGDPRSGQISHNDWISKIPFQETKGYVNRVVGGAPSGPGQTNQLAGSQIPAPPEPTGLIGLGQTPAPPSSHPLAALQLLRLITPSTHQLIPVDYNPFAPGMPGAPSPVGQS